MLRWIFFVAGGFTLFVGLFAKVETSVSDHLLIASGIFFILYYQKKNENGL